MCAAYFDFLHSGQNAIYMENTYMKIIKIYYLSGQNATESLHV